MGLVEGKDETHQTLTKSHAELRKMVGLVLQLEKYPRNKDRIFFMDSGLCVLKYIIELNKIFIFSSSLINKRRYWSKYIKGEDTKENFKEKPPGYFDALKGRMEENYFILLERRNLIM